MSYVITPLVAPDTIWLARGAFPTATSVGLHLGWFDQAFSRHGFKVSTLRESRDAIMRAQHFYHTIKTLVREGGNVHPIWRRARNVVQDGWDNTVVVGLTWLDEVQVLLARRGSGIRPGDPSSLRGKRLGVSKAPGEIDVWRAMALRGFDSALKLGGLTFDDVILKDVTARPVPWHNHNHGGPTGVQATEAALLNGEVDVIYVKGASSVLLQESHDLEVVLDIGCIDDPELKINNGRPRPITVHRHLLNDNPDLVTAYLQVLNAVARWIHSHPDEVVEIIAAETSQTPHGVRRSYGSRLSASFDISLSADRVGAFQSQVDFLHRLHLTEASFDVSDWIDATPLAAACAEPLTFN